MKIFLYPIVFLYYLIISINRLCYKLKIITPKKFNTPIISIGNIEVGGTGKTPMTLYLAQLLKTQNIVHAIVSRGYKKNQEESLL